MSQPKVTVIIHIKSGAVQHIECGDFVEVTIHDYDTENYDLDDLKTDENNELYHESVWF